MNPPQLLLAFAVGASTSAAYMVYGPWTPQANVPAETIVHVCDVCAPATSPTPANAEEWIVVMDPPLQKVADRWFEKVRGCYGPSRVGVPMTIFMMPSEIVRFAPASVDGPPLPDFEEHLLRYNDCFYDTPERWFDPTSTGANLEYVAFARVVL